LYFVPYLTSLERSFFLILNHFVKVQVKLSLWLINYTALHEEVWGSGGIAPPFLTSLIDGGEWSASLLGRFIPGGKGFGTHYIMAAWAPEPI
jgi:hypothetical protein